MNRYSQDGDNRFRKTLLKGLSTMSLILGLPLAATFGDDAAAGTVLPAVLDAPVAPAVATPLEALAADATTQVPAAGTKEKVVVSTPDPAILWGNPDGFHISNSMLTSWILAIFIMGGAIVFSVAMKKNPNGRLVAAGVMVVMLVYDFIAQTTGERLTKKTFWLLGSFFFYILLTNWFGLLTGVNIIGWGHQGTEGFVVDLPLLRSANADLNITLAMSGVFFVCWLFWALQENGPVGFLKHVFGVKGDMTGFLKLIMVVIFFVVGFLELLTFIIRPIALAVRLYGNIFAGDVMLECMIENKLPVLAYLVPLPLFGMELIVGVIQATVFTLLAAVFINLICGHDDEEHVSPDGAPA